MFNEMKANVQIQNECKLQSFKCIPGSKFVAFPTHYVIKINFVIVLFITI